MKNFKVKGEIIMEPRSVKFVVQDEKGKDAGRTFEINFDSVAF